MELLLFSQLINFNINLFQLFLSFLNLFDKDNIQIFIWFDRIKLPFSCSFIVDFNLFFDHISLFLHFIDLFLINDSLSCGIIQLFLLFLSLLFFYLFVHFTINTIHTDRYFIFLQKSWWLWLHQSVVIKILSTIPRKTIELQRGLA